MRLRLYSTQISQRWKDCLGHVGHTGLCCRLVFASASGGRIRKIRCYCYFCLRLPAEAGTKKSINKRSFTSLDNSGRSVRILHNQRCPIITEHLYVQLLCKVVWRFVIFTSLPERSIPQAMSWTVEQEHGLQSV